MGIINLTTWSHSFISWRGPGWDGRYFIQRNHESLDYWTGSYRL
jgi:hypothetical protein